MKIKTQIKREGGGNSEVIEETRSDVVFDLVDGSFKTASLIIGADGLHSRLRDHVCLGVEKKLMGRAALT